MGVKDTTVTRCYMALKLTSWICLGSYWRQEMTQTQVIRLIERGLNHPEIDSRWGIGGAGSKPLGDIDVEFADTGGSAYAIRGRKDLIHLPKDAMNPLVVLHEFAHLLAATKREPHHGPGFNAINLMVTELLAPKIYPTLLASFHALDVPYDPARIPPATRKSNYIPLSGTADMRLGSKYIATLIASGHLTDTEAKILRRSLNRTSKIQKEGTARKAAPLKKVDVPPKISIDTQKILACNNDAQLAQLIIKEIQANMSLAPLKRPPKNTERKQKRPTITT